MNRLKCSPSHAQSLTQAPYSARTITKKAYHTAATACLGFSVTCGSSMISPATPEIAERFNVSRTASILALSLFVLGLAVGPMIAAPISETYGRSVVYKVSAATFMLFILGAGFSESLASLLVCRFLAGAIGGPVLAVGAGTNADMYNSKNRAVASSLFIMMPVSSTPNQSTDVANRSSSSVQHSVPSSGDSPRNTMDGDGLNGAPSSSP
jgi:fucose permease